MTLLLLTALAACSGKPQDLLFVAPSSPIDADVLEGLAGRLNDHSEFSIRMTDERLTDEGALDLLSSGDADIALVSNIMPFREGVETVMPFYPTLLHIAYREGRDASWPGSLIKGGRVFAGFEGSASRLVFERLLERFDINEEDFDYIDVTEQDSEPDVVVIFAPLFPERIVGFSGYRLFSMGSPADIGTGSRVDAAVLLTPSYRHFVIPTGTYGAMTPEPIVTVAVDRLLVARRDLPAAVIYDFINEVLRLKPPMAAKWPGLFAELSEDFDVSRSSFNLHSGTQNYLQRTAPTIYERYSGVAEVAVTLLIGLASASVAGIQIYHRYRKNRIDTFCLRAIELRDSIPEDADQEARKRSIQKVHDLQTEAFQLLAAEKLAADESFQIFITLSNDVIRQIDAGGRERAPA